MLSIVNLETTTFLSDFKEIFMELFFTSLFFKKAKTLKYGGFFTQQSVFSKLYFYQYLVSENKPLMKYLF